MAAKNLDRSKVRPYSTRMAITKIKTTYSLDVETVRLLEGLAKRWNVSKSEAMRRAIGIAAASDNGNDGDAIEALDRLQRSVKDSNVSLRNWARRTRGARRASSEKREKAL